MNHLLLNENENRKRYLAISGAVGFNGPASFVAESFEDLIVVAVLRELVVAVGSETSKNLRGYSSSPPLSPLIVLPLLPSWLPCP